MAQANRTCVLVAGMHRSGSSALARVLNMLGCGLAKELVAPNPTNETGHWEPLEILKLNDELLESAGSAWDDWTACSPAWFSSPIAEEFKERAAHIFSEEHGTQRLTVMKDPRLARLLPFWLDTLRAAGTEPVVMIPIRNPLEVAQSLHVRDGSDPFYNQLLWLRHVLDAEAGSRGVARHFSTYDQLLDSWTSLVSVAESKLGLRFPRRSARASEEVDAYLADRHRHHRLSPKAVLGDAAASDWLKTTYAIMLRWSESGEEPKDYAQLDSIRSELDRSAGTFSRLIYRGKKAVEEVNGLHHVLAERDQQAANLRGDFEHVSNIANQQEHELGALQAKCSAEHARSADLERQLQAANIALSELAESAAATETSLRLELGALRADAEAERATSQSALNNSEERLHQTFAEINALSERAAATEANYQAQVAELEARLHQSLSELAAAHDQINAVQSARQSEQTEAESKLAAAYTEISGLQALMASTMTSHQEHVVGFEAALESEQATVKGLTDHVALLLQEIESAKEDAETRLRVKSEEHDASRISLEAALESEQATVKGLTDHVALLLQEIEAAKEDAETRLRVKSEEHDAAQSSLEAALEKEQATVKGLTDHVALLLQDIDAAKEALENAIQTKSLELAAAQSSLEATTRELNEALLLSSSKVAEVDQLSSSLAQLESAMRQRGAELDDVNGELQRVMDLLHIERHERTLVDKVVDGLKLHVKLLMEDVDTRETDLAGKIFEIQSLKADRERLENQAKQLEGRLASQTDGLMQGLINEPHRYFQTKGANLRRKAALLRSAKLLDGEAYLRANADVAAAGVDPEVHYLTAGFVEGRNRN